MQRRTARRTIILVSVWAGATLVTAAVAWGVVRLAGGGVTDSALRPLSSAQVEALGTTRSTGAPGAPSSTTSSPPSTTSVPPTGVASTTTPLATGHSPGTTTAPATTAPPPATTPPSPTTTSAPGGTRAFTYPEGTVVVRFDGSAVTLVSASPAPGYRVEVKTAGPEEVDVEFEGGGDAGFQARIEDGDLVVSFERED